MLKTVTLAATFNITTIGDIACNSQNFRDFLYRLDKDALLPEGYSFNGVYFLRKSIATGYFRSSDHQHIWVITKGHNRERDEEVLFDLAQTFIDNNNKFPGKTARELIKSAAPKN